MKTKHFKITIIISLFTLLLLLLVIPSFAYDFNGIILNNQEITFTEDINLAFYPNTSTDISFIFSIVGDPDNVEYKSIQYSYPGRAQLIYVPRTGDTQLIVYDERDGWLDDSYRHIISHQNVVLEGRGLGFFSMNMEQPETSSNTGIYDGLYELIVSNIYGDRPLTTFESLTTTILATIICVAVIGLPIIVLFWLTKLIFTVGRNW